MERLSRMAEANRAGKPTGLPCFCTANEHVLRSVLSFSAAAGLPTVIEATCNQVNQDGGYTGMLPGDFAGWIDDLATQEGLDRDLLLLGGDHLGPNPWRKQPADIAMAKARTLVRDYARAGFRKIHLDASMALGGEAHPSFECVAERAADLCEVAESAAPDPDALVYVIGTEVPVPGGEAVEPDRLDVTSVDRLRKTIDTHRAAFAARGLDAAWGRIASVVAQPGVDFGHSSVYRFDAAAAAELSRSVLDFPGLTFEAHSTDYQPAEALEQLVAGHFFFLKVGPELTFRLREALFALSDIEALLDLPHPSELKRVLEDRMIANPEHWRDYYRGGEAETRQMRQFSYSDRARYYWGDAQLVSAVRRLLENLSGAGLKETIVSQYFNGYPFGHVPTDARELVSRHVQTTVRRYFAACGYSC
ncbi:MAG: class II D-tagatose-bisphosphate aldolase, non-catalytic subunit [Rhizobiaceae bacterium]